MIDHFPTHIDTMRKWSTSIWASTQVFDKARIFLLVDLGLGLFFFFFKFRGRGRKKNTL